MAGHAGAQAFLEVGPGSVLSGLNRRIAAGVQAAPLAEPEQLRRLLEGWAGAGAAETTAAARSTEPAEPRGQGGTTGAAGPTGGAES
jgi:hypothetical protein